MLGSFGHYQIKDTMLPIQARIKGFGLLADVLVNKGWKLYEVSCSHFLVATGKPSMLIAAENEGNLKAGCDSMSLWNGYTYKEIL